MTVLNVIMFAVFQVINEKSDTQAELFRNLISYLRVSVNRVKLSVCDCH